jgi:PAS domain S-box-containing protein
LKGALLIVRKPDLHYHLFEGITNPFPFSHRHSASESMPRMLAPSRPRSLKVSWPMALIFLLVMVAVLYAGNASRGSYRAELEQATRERLDAIADLKVQQISSWLSERQGNVKLILDNPLIASRVWDFIQNPDPITQADTLAWLDSLHSIYRFRSVMLLSVEGDTLLAVPPDQPAIDVRTRQLAAQAVVRQQVISSDIYPVGDPGSADAAGSVYMDFFAPLLVPGGSSKASIGVVVVRIDPYSSLFPILETWPTNSPSAEVLLVRADQEAVLVINPPRHAAYHPLELSIPLNDSRQPTTWAGAGQEVFGEGVDYRGVNVFATTRLIPNSPWGLVAKLDRAEIYEPVFERELLTNLLTAVLFIAGALAAVLLWRQREAKFYKEEYQSEVKRQALSEHLHYLSRYANDIIFLCDERWTILEANDRALTAYGYTQEELSCMSLPQLATPESQTVFPKQIAELDEKGGLVFESVHVRKDSARFPVECSARTIQVENRKFYQCILRDITERKQAEEALRESERRFRQLYELAPVRYQLMDGEERMLDVNQAWLNAFGYAKPEVIGKSFPDFLDEASRRSWREHFASCKAYSELRHVEVTMVRLNGTRLIVAISGKIIHKEEGDGMQLHCILNDVTEQRLAEEQIRRMNEELERRVTERTAQLEAANKELEAFSYSVSHDLRAPLRAIDGFSRILMEEHVQELSCQANRYLNLVRENTRTMSNLIDNLLAFSRLSRLPLKKQRVDPEVIITQSLEVLKADQDGREIEFILNPVPPCDADPALLKQVYINLLSNAIKFTSKKPSAVIEVGCLQDKTEKIYYVRDNGVGFDMQYAPKLFGVFQRLHRVEEYEGTGVGLAIVQRIIHRHGGRVWAMGEVSEGATFCFTLEETSPHV